jgi:hypothetical protein
LRRFSAYELAAGARFALRVDSLDIMTIFDATPNVGQVMAGVIDVGGTVGSAAIAGGTPGLFIAGHVGTIGAYGAFGPIALRVIEAGVQRWLEEDPAGQVFSQPDAGAAATTPGDPNYINTQYLYESAGFTSTPTRCCSITCSSRARASPSASANTRTAPSSRTSRPVAICPFSREPIVVRKKFKARVRPASPP